MANADRSRRYYYKQREKMEDLEHRVNTLIEENQRLIDRVNTLEAENARLSEGRVNTPTTSRGTRLPPDFAIPTDWIDDGRDARQRGGLPPIDLDLEAEKFCNYWASKSGKEATKVDWHRTWTNWCLNAQVHGVTNGKQRPSPVEALWEGAARAVAARAARREAREPAIGSLLDR
jgi:hypothetical protein